MQLGVVVNFENKICVVTGFTSYEDPGSCCYNREYYLMPLEELEELEYIQEDQGSRVRVLGMTLPFEVVQDVAPFEITKEVRFKVRRKQPKVQVVYE